MNIKRIFNNKKWSKIGPENDLTIDDLKGNVHFIESRCFRDTKQKEFNRTLDNIEEDNNFFIYFNYLGFITQKINYNYDKNPQIYLFQYYSNNLLKGLKEYTTKKDLKKKVNFDYVIKNNILEKKNIYNNETLEEYHISDNLKILPFIEYISLPYRKGTIKYFYDNQGKLIKKVNTNNHITEKYKYDDNKILKVEKYDNLLSDFLIGIDYYHYDKSKLKKIEYFNSKNELEKTDLFKYDLNENWIKKEIIFKESIKYIIERNIKYYELNFPINI